MAHTELIQLFMFFTINVLGENVAFKMERNSPHAVLRMGRGGWDIPDCASRNAVNTQAGKDISVKRVLSIVAATTALAAPAFAGSPVFEPAPAPTVAPVPVAAAPVGTDWTGFYGGAQLGYGFGSLDGVADEDLDGFIGGVMGGYNYDFGQFVLGAEVDYSLADLSFDVTDGEIDQVGRLKLRAGFDAGRALIYGTGGLAYANASIPGDDLNDTGYFIGAGVDYLITDRIFGGVEYLYHQFDDLDNSGIDAQVNTVSARLGFRF